MSRGPMPMGKGGPRGPKPKFNPGTFKRIIKMLFKFYPAHMVITIVCILFAAATSCMPSIFQQKIIKDITDSINNGVTWEAAKTVILPKIIILISIYVVSIIAVTLYNQLMVVVTQGFLNKMRCHMFEKMQKLPIKYFDQNKHGDIMSHYTNDVDTMRELISRSMPTLLQSIVIVVGVLSVMLTYSVWMTLVVITGVLAMAMFSKKVGGGSAKYFMMQQKSIGKTEGFVQEMMSGQKVIKVFCHEKECNNDFDKVNEELFNASYKAHAFANCLGPIIGNLGNILYVLVATIGGLLMVTKVPNISLGCIFTGTIGVLTIDLMIPFLGLSRLFTGNVNQVTQQINTVVMALAGAERVFNLIYIYTIVTNFTVLNIIKAIY